jgi:hypothetical protein
MSEDRLERAHFEPRPEAQLVRVTEPQIRRPDMSTIDGEPGQRLVADDDAAAQIDDRLEDGANTVTGDGALDPSGPL